MTQNMPTEQQAIDRLVKYVLAQLEKGIPKDEIVRDLVKEGIPQESAAKFVQQIHDSRKSVNRDAGKKNLLIGGLFLFGGIIITLVTYANASSGGGTYIVTWGAIIFGGIQFIRGLAQYFG